METSVNEPTSSDSAPPSTLRLDIAPGVDMDLKLIPAGRFVMGTPKPVQPEQPAVPGVAVMGVVVALMLAILIKPVWQAIKGSRLPQITLRRFSLLILAMAVGVYGGVQCAREYEALQRYERDLAAFEATDQSEKPAHEVEIAKPFYMGIHEVTQKQYEAVMGKNPSHFRGPDLPVENVSWHDAKDFVEKLSEMTGKRVRLPSEVEWEYACRAGSRMAYSSGSEEKDLTDIGWYRANSGGRTHAVGSKPANFFGLHDMHGNVLEWTDDLFTRGYEPDALKRTRLEELKLNQRVLRGGSWFMRADAARSAARSGAEATMRLEYFGFRVVVEPHGRPSRRPKQHAYDEPSRLAEIILPGNDPQYGPTGEGSSNGPK